MRYTIENLSGYLKAEMVERDTAAETAFVADARELAMSQEYIALLGRQRGLQFEAFFTELAALGWLLQDGTPA